MGLSRKIIAFALVVAFATVVSAHPIIDTRDESDATYSVLLNGSQVARLAAWGGLAAKTRAEIVACRLENFIEAGDPSSVRVEVYGDLLVIRTNLGILVTVDDVTAGIEGEADARALARQWAARLAGVLAARAGIQGGYERVVDQGRPAPGRPEVADVPPAGRPAQAGSARAASSKPSAQASQATQVIEGIASWYGPGFHGRLTASGEVFDQNAMTAAHKTLPFGTRLLVKDSVSGKSVVVVINDRGPFVGNRILDLSARAAEQLDMAVRGISRVIAQVLPIH
ncbi:MAG: septal ring lytic transglycosylase RlpA family protein [Bacillota bacterium]|nr:septal ring lytic transglycosylase RlpA family protein [Bacillota bacterium]